MHFTTVKFVPVCDSVTSPSPVQSEGVKRCFWSPPGYRLQLYPVLQRVNTGQVPPGTPCTRKGF